MSRRRRYNGEDLFDVADLAEAAGHPDCQPIDMRELFDVEPPSEAGIMTSEPPPPIHPPDMPPERVCALHGIPKLRSGRCSMCRTPSSVTACGNAADAIITPAPRGQKGWRCMALLPDGRICKSMEWRIRTDNVIVCAGRGHQALDIEPVAGGAE